LNFFTPGALKGKRVVFYQHSAVGRDLLVDIFTQLGATVFPAGRSESFIPIDTEAITDDKIKDIQKLADEARDRHGVIHAIVSTDGDSDRPLLAGIDSKGKVHFLGGDLLGVLVAEFLGAKSVAVPISTNDAVDLELIPKGVIPVKTKIGSPHVIKAMQNLLSEAKFSPVVGWEANGGFLVGSDISRKGKVLKALPTRDAALPLIAALAFAGEKEITLLELFSQLPPRFSQAALIDNFSRDDGLALIRRFSPENPEIVEIEFREADVFITKRDDQGEKAIPALAEAFRRVQTELETFFTEEFGFNSLTKINTIDGVRIYFENGDIAHIRPSGNAPQLRIYAVANSQERADSITQWGTSEPDGLLRSLQRLVQA
jgi:phosphomannomutase